MPVEIFFCYAREDEQLRQGLEKQLKALRRQGFIDLWHDRNISAGTEWEKEIDKHLSTAQVILLLVSPDFMDSDYCYGIEMRQAMERHERGEARVIPVILRPVYWQGAPFGKLQALPKDAKHVTSPTWHNLDEAFFDIAEGIRKAIKLYVEPARTPGKASKELTREPGASLSMKPVKTLKPELAKSVSVSELEEFTFIRTLPKLSYRVWSIAISSDGQTLACGSGDRSVKVWNLHTGELLRTLDGHLSGICSVAIDPDGHILASGSVDKTIKIWGRRELI